MMGENDRFKNKTVLITGTSKGIGKALTEYFLKEGAVVVAVSRGKATFSPGIDASKLIILEADIKDRDCLREKLNELKLDVDILINNAGIICYEKLLDISRSQLEEVLDVNVVSTFLLSQMIAQRIIREKRQGVIINTLSFASQIPSVGSGVYAASKAALTSLTKTMAAEWAPYGIRVNGYSPGVIETDMTLPAIEKNKEQMVNNIALHTIGSTEQMTSIVAFLASEDSAYMTGVNLDASGGKFIVQNAEAAWEKER